MGVVFESRGIERAPLRHTDSESPVSELESLWRCRQVMRLRLGERDEIYCDEQYRILSLRRSADGLPVVGDKAHRDLGPGRQTWTS